MPNPTHPEQNPKPSAEVDIDALPDVATPEQILQFKAAYRRATAPGRYPPGGNSPYDTGNAPTDAQAKDAQAQRDREDQARARGGH